MPHRLSLSEYQAVLFDVDGTLLDSLEAVVLGLGDTCVEYFGYRPEDSRILSLIGKPIRVQLETFSQEKLTEEQLAEMTAHAIGRFEHHQNLERMYWPAIEAMRLCHRCGLKVALVTSKSAAELELFLQRFPGADVVDSAVCSSDVRLPKPAPDCAYLACERVGVASTKAVFVGDSIYDVQCAHAAGIPVVAVSYGAAPKDALVAESPTLLMETPEALLEWVQASFLEQPCRERS